MIFEFYGTATVDICMINTITFLLSDGREVIIDRDTTEYTVENNNLSMLWRGCYIWDGGNKNYLDSESEINLFFNAKIIDIDIEEDAPENYNVTIYKWECYQRKR